MEIIKNKPLPTGHVSSGGRPAKYPFAEMDVGDCFPVGATRVEAERVRGAMKSYAAKRSGSVKFSVRSDGGSYFCWRIE